MIRYAGRRLGFYAVAALVAIAINFFLPRLMPGDPATAMLAQFQGQSVTDEVMEALRQAFGLTDGTLLEQFGTYLKSLAAGDWGISLSNYPVPVTDVIGDALLWTLVLAGTSVTISFALGTMMGLWAAWRRGGLFDTLVPPFFVFLGAFPYFWLAMVLLYVFGFQLDMFPLRYAHSPELTPEWSFQFLGDAFTHAFLPVMSIVLASVGGWMLAMRNNMVSILGTDTIRLAQAKGLSSRRVLFMYAARNALLPSVTGFGMALGFVLGGALLTEIVFSYQGTGYLLVQAVRTQDYPLMQGLFLVITLAVLLANWLVDLAIYWLDPRTREDA